VLKEKIVEMGGAPPFSSIFFVEVIENFHKKTL
jgi:hypothetical protein